jgi:hypothetical protein
MFPRFQHIKVCDVNIKFNFNLNVSLKIHYYSLLELSPFSLRRVLNEKYAGKVNLNK